MFDVTSASIVAAVAAGTFTKFVVLSNDSYQVYGANSAGSNITGSSNTVQAWAGPVLFDGGSATANWTWSGSNPTYWQLWDVNTSLLETQVSGTARNASVGGDCGDTFYVVGVDSLLNPLTAQSNQLTVSC